MALGTGAKEKQGGAENCSGNARRNTAEQGRGAALKCEEYATEKLSIGLKRRSIAKHGEAKALRCTEMR